MRKKETTAVAQLVRYLEQEGVDTIFGIPGGPLMPLYEAIFDSGRIRPIISKHEGGAAFMADGYARVSGGLGVCCATTGPGATNAMTGVACARVDSIPMMLITAQVAMKVFGKGAAQESSMLGVDTVEMFRPATKSSVMLLSPQRMAETARFLLRKGLTGRTGPVHLSLPADMAKQPVSCEGPSSGAYRAQARCFDREAVEAACQRLVRARRPAILAGHGVFLSRAWDELRRLAERLRIPVATSPKAKGVFPEDHALSMGVLGFAGSPQADACFLEEDVDVMLVVGSSLGELTTHCWNERFPPSEAMIHVDIDPGEIGKNFPVELGLVGEAKTVLGEMLDGVDRELRWLDGPDLPAREQRVRRIKRERLRRVESDGSEEDNGSPIHPRRLIHELEEAMPHDTILFVDIGNVMAWAIHFLRIVEPGSFHINLGLASMGHAVAAAIGGKAAAPDRPVVALVGDAAFAMNGAEVHAAVEAELPVVWVVMNNGGHGMVRHGERLQFKGKFQTGKFHRPLDIAGMAVAMGAEARRVESPGDFGSALRAALASGQPTVLDVITDPEAMPPLAMRIETLDEFFKVDGEPAEPAPVETPAPEIVVHATAPVGVGAGGNGNGNGNGHSKGHSPSNHPVPEPSRLP